MWEFLKPKNSGEEDLSQEVGPSDADAVLEASAHSPFPAKMQQSMATFIATADVAKSICDSEMDGQLKYNLVFSPACKGEIDRTGIRYEWLDLDGSYEEDARAFVEGIVEKAKELRILCGEPFERNIADAVAVSPIKINIAKFVTTADTASRICDSEMSDWEAKYQLVFSDDIKGAISATGIEVEWFDPDMDYEDDARAYVRALEEKAKELRKLVASE